MTTEYGKSSVTLSGLAEKLTEKYGKGYTRRSLYKYMQFYRTFPEIVPSVTAQSQENGIVPAAKAQLLSWTHYETLLQVYDETARNWVSGTTHLHS